MFIHYRRTLGLLPIGMILGVCLSVLSAGTAAANEVVVLRSGNAAVGLPDPFITMLVGGGAAPLSSAPFTSADFDLACSTTSAFVAQPHPAWLPSLPCDPLAQWVGTDPVATPASALYCYSFNLETCCIEHATLSFCWATDDILGDPAGSGPNPDGVYLNGVPVSPSIFGGNYAAQTQAPLTDVTNLLRCGPNRLEVYNRDLGFIVSGVIFSATIDVAGCATPAQSPSWGVIKSLYR
jgi:hypothetical protein